MTVGCRDTPMGMNHITPNITGVLKKLHTVNVDPLACQRQHIRSMRHLSIAVVYRQHYVSCEAHVYSRADLGCSKPAAADNCEPQQTYVM